MLEPRIEQFDKFVKMREKSTDALFEYWKDYSLYSSFEFWMMVAILLVPLVVLILKIDKSKIFLICFFGYSVHMLFAYVDIVGINSGLWNYPFPLFPYLPALSIDSSLVPVTFMLVYQWTLNNNKNHYLYLIITALVFAFAFKPLLVALGLFKMYKGINYFHLFLGYFFVLLAAKFITNVFLWISKKYTKSI